MLPDRFILLIKKRAYTVRVTLPQCEIQKRARTFLIMTPDCFGITITDLGLPTPLFSLQLLNPLGIKCPFQADNSISITRIYIFRPAIFEVSADARNKPLDAFRKIRANSGFSQILEDISRTFAQQRQFT